MMRLPWHAAIDQRENENDLVPQMAVIKDHIPCDVPL